MMVGTPRVQPGNDNVFGPVLDDLVKLSPCPTLVVKSDKPEPRSAARVIIPTDGSAYSMRALDLAMAVAEPDAAIVVLHVVAPTRTGVGTERARDLRDSLQERVNRLAGSVDVRIMVAPDVELAILTAVREMGADLLVLGTSVRSGTRRLHLGPRVENLVTLAPCSVMILNT